MWLYKSVFGCLNRVVFYKAVIFALLLTSVLATNANAYEEIDLSLSEKKIFSQNGEDGVIEKIFSTIGVTNQFYVEFGVENGKECNTRYLREVCGWSGLMMDGSNENASINLHKEYITAENINELFAKYNVPFDFDLLSIDIDGNDFYVWHAIQEYSPKVVVIEYNASYTPPQDKIIVYDPNYVWNGTDYFGASFLSLKKLGAHKGYTLIYAENQGINLFFVRDDIAKQYRFKNAGCMTLYKCPMYGSPCRGFQKDPQRRSHVTFEEALCVNSPKIVVHPFLQKN